MRHAAPSEFAALVRERANALANASPRSAGATGITLRPLDRAIDADGYRYRHVTVSFDRAARAATLTVHAPPSDAHNDLASIEAAGDAWWPLAMARELDDALLLLRTNERELGLIVLRTSGDLDAVLAADRALIEHRDHWLVRETLGMVRRTLARLDVTSRSLYAVVDEGSCFGGVLYELAAAADRVYMLALDEGGPQLALDELNFGPLPAVNARPRLETRLLGDPDAYAKAQADVSQRYDARAALDAGLVTVAPDDLDWDDEIRLACEERAALSPDALSGLEASLRFPGPETLSRPRSSAASRPGRIGSSSVPTRRASAGRSNFSAAGPSQTSTGSVSDVAIDYTERIPNNVELASNRTLQRALEHWQPAFLNWWRELGPTDFPIVRCVFAHGDSRSTPRAGRTTATSRCPTTAGEFS